MLSSYKKNNDFSDNPIDTSLLPVLPFKISNKVKLIILGQDPTVKIPESSKSIEYTLNLSINGSLKNYIKSICSALGIEFENVYATNVFKYFYSIPPERTMHVLHKHLKPNIELLKEEIKPFDKAPIITFGLPVLKLLSDVKDEVSYYWDYNKNTKSTGGDFKFCKSSQNILNRVFFPFPHQPSLGKDFYKDTLEEYLKYVRKNLNT